MLLGILMLVIFIPVFWALVIRPQQKEAEQREHDHLAVVDSLVAGDRVESFSGIQGTIVEVRETTVRIEIADGVVVTMARLAVSSKLDDGGDDDEGGDDDGQDGLVQQVSNPEPTDDPSVNADGDLS
ncbi:preprotein translocase subunit YajC [Aquihabitans daechungensis]|uniref:preprotein translocase subunit YajC n=1 Tax=Aquihabitans daechungensis TaxID=1052257 RepID=UPI003BA32FBB